MGKSSRQWWMIAGAAAGAAGSAVLLRRMAARRSPAFALAAGPSRGLALITGASSGIGEAFARRLAKAGYDLILVARRKERLEALATELGKRCRAAVEVFPADLTHDDDIARLEERIRQADRLDMLVNNAGFGIPGNYSEANIDEQVSMVQVHVVAAMRLARTALPRMVSRQRGAIINVSSVSAFAPMPGNVTYGATKAYLNAFTESLQVELRGTGVQVQALCPGFTYTEFHDKPYFPKDWRRTIPAIAWMNADDVARASLNALAAGDVIYVPGLVNKLLVQVLKIHLSRPIVRAVVAAARRMESKWQ